MHLKMIDQYRGLPKQVYVLMTARLIIATGAFIYPFLTMFLSSRIGMNDQQVSHYLLAVALVHLPANLLGGKLADRFNRKRVYFFALLFSALVFGSCGFLCGSKQVIYPILVGYFFSNMAPPIVSAMIMDATTEQNRQESFSLVYLGFNIGYAFGPLIAGLLFEHHTPWIFWGQGILTAMAAMLIWFFSPQVTNQTIQTRQKAVRQESLAKLLWRDPAMLLFILFMTSYAFAYAQISYLMPLDLEQTQGVSVAAKVVSGVWSINGASVFLLTPLIVLLTKRNPSVINTALGGFIYLLGFGGMALCKGTPWMILTLVLVWTSGEILCNTNSGVFIASHAPATHRARYQAIYEIVHNLGKALGPLVMGFYLLGHDYHQGWLLVALICGLAALGMVVMQYTLIRRSETPPDPAQQGAGDA